MGKKISGAVTWIIIGVIALIGSISSILWKKDGKRYEDNPVEETSEEIIKKLTGVDIDLTPNSKE